MGVENSKVIDFVGYNPQTDKVTLAMVEERDWDGSEERLLELQTKINNYMSFVLDGQFAQAYPQYKDKEIEFQLNCSSPPDARTSTFLEQVKNALKQYDITWTMKVQSPPDEFSA
jgi:hypothetical protein